MQDLWLDSLAPRWLLDALKLMASAALVGRGVVQAADRYSLMSPAPV